MPRHPALSDPARALPRSVFDRLWPRARAAGVAIAPLHLGDTCLPPPIAARLGNLGFTTGDELDHYRYAPPAGWSPLIDAVVAKLVERNRLVDRTADHVQITAGATHALSIALRAVADAGDEIVLPSPHWPLIRGIARGAGVASVEVVLPVGDPAALEASLEAVITPRTTALYVATPNNPDGRVLDDGELAAFAAVARRHHLWVLADEVYEHGVFDGGVHRSIAALPGMAARACTTYSASKSYGLAGLRVGYLVAPAELVPTCRSLAMHSIYSVPRAMQAAALAALEQGDDYLAEARGYLQAARDRAVGRIAVPTARPAGASYLFLDLGAWIGEGEASAIGVLERIADVGVLLAPGELFGAAWTKHARLCFGAMASEDLDGAIDRINRVLAR